MSPPPLAYEDDRVRLYHCSHQELAAHLRETGERVDALIVDAPYSARTHVGHDDGVDQSGRDVYHGLASKRTAAVDRRPLSYSSWGVEEVGAFVTAWAPLTRGWFVSLTDHVLAPQWEAHLFEQDRYVFAPLAFTDSGSRVRLVGDGPSNWSVWLVPSRPRTREFQRWGTLPGAYVVEDGERDDRNRRSETGVVGGKPPGTMRRIVRDYSRPGGLVCDPCAGGARTLWAARVEGRRAIGCEIDAETCEKGAEYLRALPQRDRRGTLSLFGSR